MFLLANRPTFHRSHCTHGCTHTSFVLLRFYHTLSSLCWALLIPIYEVCGSGTAIENKYQCLVLGVYLAALPEVPILV